MPSANYVWPQLLNKYARKVIEANGGEVVFEEYYPLDQPEYSATIGKIRDGKVDCVFNTVIPPGLQPFVKQLYESRLPEERRRRRAASTTTRTCSTTTRPHEMEGLVSCLDYFQAVDDPFSKKLQAGLQQEVPGHEVPVHRRQRVYRHVSRHQVLRGSGQGDRRRARARGGGSRARQG